MKFLIFYVLLLTFCNNFFVYSWSESYEEFIKWTLKHDKTYSSSEEFEYSYRNYLESKRILGEIRGKGRQTFRVGLNKFADLSEDERLEISNGFKDVPEFRGRAIRNVKPGDFPPAPQTWDWQARGAVTPVKDQGFFCNGCWAFSAIASLESQLLIKYGKNYSLSEQQLLDCNRHDVVGNWGCNGGSQSSAYQYIEHNGIQETDSYLYENYLPLDNFDLPCRSNSSRNIPERVSGYLRIRPRNETFLKEVVAAVGPVAFAFNGKLPSFQYYENGVYDDPECTSGLSHSGLIVGYGTLKRVSDGQLIPYWKVKNSWSEEWGERGYFRMVRGKNMCGMTNFLIVPTV